MDSKRFLTRVGVVGLLVGNGFPYVYLLGCGDSVTVNGPSGSGGDGSGGTSGTGTTNGTSGVVTSGTTSVGSNVTTSTTSGTGGSSNLPPPTPPCWECLEKGTELCSFEIQQCMNDLACQVLANCYEQCGWTGACVQQCNSIVPNGVQLVTAVMQCAGCNQCPDACAGTSVMLFCRH